jgi:hypothetical protein
LQQQDWLHYHHFPEDPDDVISKLATTAYTIRARVIFVLFEGATFTVVVVSCYFDAYDDDAFLDQADQAYICVIASILLCQIQDRGVGKLPFLCTKKIVITHTCKLSNGSLMFLLVSKKKLRIIL